MIKLNRGKSLKKINKTTELKVIWSKNMFILTRMNLKSSRDVFFMSNSSEGVRCRYG